MPGITAALAGGDEKTLSTKEQGEKKGEKGGRKTVTKQLAPKGIKNPAPFGQS